MADPETKNSSSLEGETTSVDAGNASPVMDTNSLEGSSTASSEATKSTSEGSGNHSSSNKPRRFTGKFNIYLLGFILVIIIAGAIVLVTALSGRNAAKQEEKTIATQTLDKNTLDQLANTDATVGDPKQVLSIQSNAVFAGKVLVRDSLDVAGTIRVGGALTLPGITVSGESNFDQVQVNKTLNIGGDASILGQLTVKKNISSSGSATFGGPLTAPQITTSNLQLIGDLNVTRHIAAGGATPGRTNGGALGSGGTASVSGSDTAGNVNINSGSGASAGCFVTVNFAQKFNSTPSVLLTPVGSGAAGLNYYVNRSTSSFSICVASAPPSNASFGFDYFVID